MISTATSCRHLKFNNLMNYEVFVTETLKLRDYNRIIKRPPVSAVPQFACKAAGVFHTAGQFRFDFFKFSADAVAQGTKPCGRLLLMGAAKRVFGVDTVRSRFCHDARTIQNPTLKSKKPAKGRPGYSLPIKPISVQVWAARWRPGRICLSDTGRRGWQRPSDYGNGAAAA